MIEAWEQQRNQKRATVDWRFSTVDARTKFERLYPTPSLSYPCGRVLGAVINYQLITDESRVTAPS